MHDDESTKDFDAPPKIHLKKDPPTNMMQSSEKSFVTDGVSSSSDKVVAVSVESITRQMLQSSNKKIDSDEHRSNLRYKNRDEESDEEFKLG
jgi:hypothetical protein